MKTSTLYVVLWTMVVAIFVTACRPSDSEAQGGSTLKACELLSAEQVGTILGETFVPKEKLHKNQEDVPAVSSCTFAPSNTTSMTSLNLLVVPGKLRGNPEDALREHINSLRENLSDPAYSLEPLDGLGGAAGFDSQMNQLTIFEKNRKIFLTLNRRPKDKNKAFLVELARIVLAH